MKKYISILLLVFAINTLSFSQTRAERKQAKKEKTAKEFEETKALIASGNFQFEANWATPLGNDATNIGRSLPGGSAIFKGGRVDVSNNDNHVKINQNNADLFLPYFGRVFFPKRINNERGILYKGQMKNYKVDVKEKKQRISIKFECDSPGDFLKFSYSITSGGSAILSVNSTNRQTISYTGKIIAIQAE